jgi:uncharacterized SAM-binding protein YcdF (DUF218 family)
VAANDETPAIVIFGAAVRPDGNASCLLRHRVQAAVACGSGFSMPLFIATGGVGRHPPAEAQVMKKILMVHGVPSDQILTEETGTDTLSSACAVTRILKSRRHTGQVRVATSAYHLPRCLLLLRLLGIPARACPLPRAISRKFLMRWFWRLREIPAVPYDVAILIAVRLVGRLRQ